jgi:hypothetical protein
VGNILGFEFKRRVDEFKMYANILVETVNLVRKSLNYVSGGGFKLPETPKKKTEYPQTKAGTDKTSFSSKTGYPQTKSSVYPQTEIKPQAQLSPPINPGELQRQAALPPQKFAANIVFTDNRTTGTINLGKNTKEFSGIAKTGRQEISIGAA